MFVDDTTAGLFFYDKHSFIISFYSPFPNPGSHNHDNIRPPDPEIIVNGETVNLVGQVVHLGHLLSENITNCNTTKCISDFNRQTNIFLADFKNVSSDIRNYLFQCYCNSFYGTNIMSVFDGSLESVCTAWRKAVRRIWRIPWRTHNNMLPIIAGVMSPDFLMFAKRSINFINYSMFSNNIVIKTITRMGMASCHSRIGANTRHLHACFGMNASNVDSYWKRYVDSNRQLEHKCLLVNDLIGIRDSVAIEDISHTHCRELIEFLCTCE